MRRRRAVWPRHPAGGVLHRFGGNAYPFAGGPYLLVGALHPFGARASRLDYVCIAQDSLEGNDMPHAEPLVGRADIERIEHLGEPGRTD